MKVTELHNITPVDTRRNSVRLVELKEALIQFKKTNDLRYALVVMKNCLTLVNDVRNYSKPIKLDVSYLNYAKSFIDSNLNRKGRFNYFRDFDSDFSHYLTNELYNDFAPRFYCKQWFSTVVGVLILNGFTFSDIEDKYQYFIHNPLYEQKTIFEYINSK